MSTETTVRRAATIADLERAEGCCELIHGEIVATSPTGFEHAEAVGAINDLLRVWNRTTAAGHVLAGDPGFVLDDENVRAPDVAFVSAERAQQAPKRGFARFVPQLAVEVVSPSDSWSAVTAKVQQWQAHGVDEVWVVDPQTRTVEVHRGSAQRALAAGDVLDGGAVLPGFSCRVGEMFA